jgi:hypothetical protein
MDMKQPDHCVKAVMQSGDNDTAARVAGSLDQPFSSPTHAAPSRRWKVVKVLTGACMVGAGIGVGQTLNLFFIALFLICVGGVLVWDGLGKDGRAAI